MLQRQKIVKSVKQKVKYIIMFKIETMPCLCGAQLYPYGFPISPNQIIVNGVSVEDIFIRKGNGTFPHKEDEEICRQYMLYHFLAPMYDFTEADRELSKTLSYDELWDLCLDNGIDPF